MNENIPGLSPEEFKELEDIDKAWHSESPLALEKVAKKYNYTFEELGGRYGELCEAEKNSHNMKFVGRVGQFSPIKPGRGGGVLYRVNNNKNYAAPGSTGYRWLESEMVRELNKQDDIDYSFYDNLVDSAVETIAKYGDFEWFVSDDPYIRMIR